MKYFFILGSNQAISFAELSAVLNRDALSLICPGVALLEQTEMIDAKQLIRRLGGIIKIGQIFAETKNDTAAILAEIKPYIKPAAGKYRFGFSYYGPGKLNLRPLGMELKKFISANGTSCRWVISREQTLSSVVVEQNGLLKNGAEFILIRSDKKIFLGQTLAVQPFKELEIRDYGRPARDDLSGMLPPKLAQIMINLAGIKRSEKLLDPFCGSGTIMTEAALLGHEHIYGADLAQKAVDDSQKNLNWIKNKYSLSVDDVWIKKIDSTKISQFLKPESIDAIVTEPYLGPQRGKIETRLIVKELEMLYAASLIEFHKILKKAGRVVMIWPAFNAPTGRIMLSQKIIGRFKIAAPLPYAYNYLPGATGRQTLLYGRAGQKVWREIIILEK